MKRLILLDSGPLGLITNPRMSPASQECTRWMRMRLVDGDRVVVPEIADYEVRRELLRAAKTAGIRRLNKLKTEVEYLPITTDAILLAAEYWAQARRRGRPTAPDLALDGDVILAAQATVLSRQGEQVVIATMNVAHLAQFVDARRWDEIR